MRVEPGQLMGAVLYSHLDVVTNHALTLACACTVVFDHRTGV